MLTRFFAVAVVLLLAASARAAESPQLYAPPGVEEARAACLAWLKSAGHDDPELLAAVEEMWKFEGTPTAPERFDAVMRTFYLADAGVRALVDVSVIGGPRRAADLAVLNSRADSPFFINNVRLFYARYLAVSTLYEEALELFHGIDVAHVADPATCLFYKAVCEQHLLLKEEGLATLTNLLENTEDVPVRYSTVAELMRHDLQEVREKSLDEVARQMNDVRRRLSLGRAGEKVQRVEERIIATLDEIIEKLEQQQGGGGGGGSSNQGGQPSNPADDSYVGGKKGPGEVDSKKIGHKDNWGELPEKDQTAAKNMINRQFPAHYRQAVEEYLKKIAQREAP